MNVFKKVIKIIPDLKDLVHYVNELKKIV